MSPTNEGEIAVSPTSADAEDRVAQSQRYPLLQNHSMRLRIELPSTWAQHDNPNGPVTYCRTASNAAFQVSWAEYRGVKPLPEITADSLKQMAIRFGQKNEFGEIVESFSGACRFGSFGTVVFRSVRHPRIQVWFISNRRDHIMATHICDHEPDMDEVAEAQQIAVSLELGPEQPAKSKWKFW